VHWGERAVVVSRRTRVVYGSAGSEERYDALVFATGSSPHIPPIKNLFRPDGTRVPGVCEFRTLADCVRIMALLNGARRVAIMGGGLLGLEASRGLAPHRCRLDLLHRGDRLLSDGLDDAAALLLLQRVREMGIQVHLKRSVSALAGSERVTGLVLDDGSVLPCELVVVATGLIPNTWLAYQCGLTVERGIAVDAQMRCLEDRSIYALGECAQPRGKTFGLAAAIRQQAKLLAEHLTGGAPSTGLASTTKRERHANDRARPIELAR
jgi:nitrite reductase (NADH) large subunit